MDREATILVLAGVLALCGVGLADELHVPGDYNTIQAAIDVAVDGDEVVVADGTYTGQGVSNNGIHFIDFRGKAITVKSQNGPENCVIDFKSAIYDCGFMFYRQEGRDSVLDGLTLRGGYRAVNCADNSSPTIQNCVITGKTTEHGGGINCYDSSPLIINCTIRENRAKWGSGGGIYCRGQSSPVIENCTISENTAPRGGGIYCDNEGFEDTGPLIINCTVTNNTAEYEDGGICTEYSSATIVDCIVSNNRTRYGDGAGGIACRSGGRTTISNSIISNNESSRAGGILCVNSSVQISNCTITENLVGGVKCTDGDVTITNCRISGNIGSGLSCARSGCIISNCELTGHRLAGNNGVVNCLFESEIMIRNCTIADNKAHTAGVIRDAGIRCSDGGSLTVTNSVLWSGSIENVGQGTYVTVTYSDIEGGYLGEGNIDADPCFAFAGDYHLAPDSPCIDTGDTNYVPEPNEADLDGKVRISGSAIDMGAYEFGHERALIAVSKRVVELFVREGQAHSSEEIMGIRNCGGAELKWGDVEDCRWLSVRPKTGSNLGEIDEVVFRANGTALEHGDYTCMAQVVDRQALCSPRQIAVTLHVNRTQLVPEQYGTIQAAIDDSVNGDLVLVADGTYTGEGNRDIDFLGKAITVQSESGPENCIIDCNGSEAEPHRGFYFQNIEDGNSILDGFTITNGYAATYAWSSSGGAIWCYGSSPTITNCVIANSSAVRGGGVSCVGGSTTLTNCTISANKARYDGGGVYMYGGRPVIANCLITGNIAESDGGGIQLGHASPVVSNCTIAENSASYRGGAIYYSGAGSAAIINCILGANQAAYGPQVYLLQSAAKVSYTDVQGGRDNVYLQYGSTLDWGPGNIDEDPCFFEPGYWDVNGVWVEGDYRLLEDSPCIDSGDPNYQPEPNETDLDGNPRMVNDRIDMGAYEHVPPIEAAMKLMPRTVNCGSKGKSVKAHIILPEGFSAEDVDVDEPAVAGPMDVESQYIKVIGNVEGPVRLEVGFDREGFCEGDEVEVTVVGWLTSGREFYGTDTIRIIHRR